MAEEQLPKIARMWHGVVPGDKSEEYLEYLKETGISDYRELKGNLGVQIFRRSEKGMTHFLLITFWDSYDSIRKFAGDDFQRAKYYPKDEEYLTELEPFVTHYDVIPN